MSMRHPLHSICPYFAMFPEKFVAEQLLRFTSPGDLVYDPFCGRGTTVFESLLMERRAGGSDVNPVAVCISSAKATAPQASNLFLRIDALENQYRDDSAAREAPSQFFRVCYEHKTLAEILFLRETLDWRTTEVDCFLAAVMLGILHGESHRTKLCLSNRMPRTISTKPAYSLRWWEERNLLPPRRPVFQVLRKAVAFRYQVAPAKRKGIVRQSDARTAARVFPEFTRQVKLVVTSPPYLNTTDYSEDQWLRLWFLGGEPYPELRKSKDDRHRRTEAYWNFLNQSWAGLSELLGDKATIVIRMGGAKLSKAELFAGLTTGLYTALARHDIEPLNDGVTSAIRPRETTAFRPTRRRPRMEHDFTFQAKLH